MHHDWQTSLYTLKSLVQLKRSHIVLTYGHTLEDVLSIQVNAAKVDWHDITKAVPAFLTIIIMPLTYSIAYGKDCPDRLFQIYP